MEQSKINYEGLKFEKNFNYYLNYGYINFFQTKDIILIPKFEIIEDNQAPEQIEMSDFVGAEGGALNSVS